ncbi:MAG: M20/M25/M40 family metallo-hydrolase [Anaerolineae bacterium]
MDQHAEEYVERLQALCRQPSIAAQDVGMEETGQMVVAMLEGIGAQVQVIPTSGQPCGTGTIPQGRPVVYGHLAGAGDKTLSFYNHYDVQPPEPLEAWESDPFAAEIRQGRLYARGASDNKGDLVARICALDAYQAVAGELPLNVKFIIEGEEEIGSPHLGEFAQAHSDLLAADGCIWEGSYRDPRGRLEIWLGVKGICYVELTARGARDDLHSMWATVVPNPAWRLTWALGTLKDREERVLIPGFYDRVQPPTEEERALLARMEFDEEGWQERFGLPGYLLGLSGVDLLEKHIFQPTCNICGIVSGYTGPGLKTVLPNQAKVKIDFRLVPDQDPHEVLEQLRAHLAAQGLGDIQVELLAGEHPAKTPLDAPLAQTAIQAARQLYDSEPVVYPMVPGTGPMYVLCQRFGIPAVSIGGVADAASNTHAPNESIRLDDFIQGIKLAALILHRFATST